MKIRCNKCNVKLVIGKNWSGILKNQHTYECRKCRNERYRKYYIKDLEKSRKLGRESHKRNRKQHLQHMAKIYKINAKVMHVLKSNGCAMCGYSKCDDALDFHHANSKDKEFQISASSLKFRDERVVDELNKCILLCANCHREIHYKERKQKR